MNRHVISHVIGRSTNAGGYTTNSEARTHGVAVRARALNATTALAAALIATAAAATNTAAIATTAAAAAVPPAPYKTIVRVRGLLGRLSSLEFIVRFPIEMRDMGALKGHF